VYNTSWYYTHVRFINREQITNKTLESFLSISNTIKIRQKLNETDVVLYILISISR